MGSRDEGTAVSAAGRATADVLAHRLAQIGAGDDETADRWQLLGGLAVSHGEIARQLLTGGPTHELREELLYHGSLVLRMIAELDAGERYVPVHVLARDGEDARAILEDAGADR